MGEAEGIHTKAHHLSGWPQENRSGAESAVGEGEESCVTGKFRSKGTPMGLFLFMDHRESLTLALPLRVDGEV